MTVSQAGWYPDPQDTQLFRWFDGQTWTAHTRARRVVVEVPRVAPTEPPAPSAAAIVNPPIASPASLGPVALSGEIARLVEEYESWKQRVVEVSDVALLQEVGIYAYRHRLEDALAYKERLGVVRDQIKELAKAGGAISSAKQWAINGSTTEGAKMVGDLSKLMLRAYNNEADAVIATMRPYALDSALKRLTKSKDTVSRLGARMQIAVTDAYHALRVAEIELTADYLSQVAEEKELERAERERLREEEKAQREFQREQEKLEKERSHYETLLAAMHAKGDAAAISTAESKIAEINAAIDGVHQRAANIRAGYVYIISNVGSFGERMVKIGLTRRLDPLDRVRELGDASVPFRFDVHAIIFSNDAVGLEGKLHDVFTRQRVNMVNARREFFFVTPTEVAAALRELDAQVLTFVDAPEALEWHQSTNLRNSTADRQVMEGA